MSRSTTPDLMKMQLKLEEFFTQQFKSSKRVFSSLHPNYGTMRRDKKEPASSPGESQPQQHQELRHHRCVLGGSMELLGSNISLACFHGTSMKAKSWALFSLKDPCISFATEAQQHRTEEASLGGAASGAGGEAGSGHQSLATVCRMSRTVLFPPQFKTLREWFQYAFADSEIDDRMPVVECSFITEFEDHIFVSVDAEAFLFLHDLISGYIKEKERLMPGGRASNGEVIPALPPIDFRDYHCLTWHLEPTVRLLSWAGKSIEPYGVDYILQKLGFRHARTTIPKWLQRGALDPLDKLLAVSLLRLLHLVHHK
ncbi:unnamed protein product [Leptidea sinapis]|uniref:Bridge-like lipid transfer protein family member 1 C-terminal domain-containing protein n=1 Tax=Leptidea sinapis TaxID=189913 RepID=A0A5E4PU53_9NEOP|nr:unnamed protein product [Leptidea sinapis]